MKQTINLHDFRRGFEQCQPDNFSYEGLEALYIHLIESEEACGEELEFDVIGFCCDFTEYGSLKEFNEYYNSANPFDTWDEVAENTCVILVGDSGAIVQDF